jgi:hypothetical protein
MAYKSDDSCLKKAKEDEPLFILRGQDMSSPRIVLMWIIENINNPMMPDDKLREAFELALKQKNYHTKKLAD